jgi:hypothetical protein
VRFALFPLPIVEETLGSAHCTHPMHFVASPLPVVDSALLFLVHLSIAMFHVIEPLPVVVISIRQNMLSPSLSLSVSELTPVVGPIACVPQLAFAIPGSCALGHFALVLVALGIYK